jgi:acyl-CoA thioester hydrolase
MSGDHDTPSVRPWPDLAGRLITADGVRVHVLPVRVYFEDTDFSGLVYHASYVRWCERGRSDFLRLLGSEHRALIAPVAGGQPKAQGETTPVAGGQPKAQGETTPVAGGQPKAQPRSEPAAFVVRRLNLEYMKPARIDDVLEVTTRVKELTAATLVLDQRVSRGVDTLCTAEVTVVLVSLSGRVMRLSAALKAGLTQQG